MTGRSINFLDAVMQEAKRVNSRFRKSWPAIDDLWEFMDANKWFGLEYTGKGREICVASLDPITDRLQLWLKAYGRSREEKVDLMLEAYEPVLPGTCWMFRKYIADNDCKGKDSTWKALDFLLYTLDGEIAFYDEQRIRSLILRANKVLPLTGMHLLVDFLNMSSRKEWSYEFQGRQLVKTDNSAYSLEQFSIMAYTIFNEESWKEHELIKKASENRKYADLWLFTAIHFAGANRKTDICRLPIPSLPYPPNEIRKKIIDGTLSGKEARAISEELLFRLEMKPIKPSKTKQYSSIPNLKLSIAESVMEPMGIILALSLSWRQPGDPFVSVKTNLQDTRYFFGDEFVKALSGKRFSARRANKSYLQGIEVVADNDSGAKPKGYILAALARCHKGGIGRLPEMTDIYLRDAKFSGYKPEFILREMFERGIFGFIPALLLEHYLGKSFLRLDVSGQTKLIKELGLDAFQLEGITACVERSMKEARSIVRSLLHEQGEKTELLQRTLQNIASGAAPSKQPEFLCLRSAAGFSCEMKGRTGCLGCRYEIYTKSAAHLLMKEYVRLNHAMEDSNAFSRKRLKNILEMGILPAIAEIMTSIPMLYPDSEMNPIYAIVERGMEDADCTSNRGMR